MGKSLLGRKRVGAAFKVDFCLATVHSSSLELVTGLSVHKVVNNLFKYITSNIIFWNFLEEMLEKRAVSQHFDDGDGFIAHTLRSSLSYDHRPLELAQAVVWIPLLSHFSGMRQRSGRVRGSERDELKMKLPNLFPMAPLSGPPRGRVGLIVQTLVLESAHESLLVINWRCSVPRHGRFGCGSPERVILCLWKGLHCIHLSSLAYHLLGSKENLRSNLEKEEYKKMERRRRAL